MEGSAVVVVREGLGAKRTNRCDVDSQSQAFGRLVAIGNLTAGHFMARGPTCYYLHLTTVRRSSHDRLHRPSRGVSALFVKPALKFRRKLGPALSVV